MGAWLGGHSFLLFLVLAALSYGFRAEHSFIICFWCRDTCLVCCGNPCQTTQPGPYASVDRIQDSELSFDTFRVFCENGTLQAVLDKLDGGKTLASEQAYIDAMQKVFPL